MKSPEIRVFVAHVWTCVCMHVCCSWADSVMLSLHLLPFLCHADTGLSPALSCCVCAIGDYSWSDVCGTKSTLHSAKVSQAWRKPPLQLHALFPLFPTLVLILACLSAVPVAVCVINLIRLVTHSIHEVWGKSLWMLFSWWCIQPWRYMWFDYITCICFKLTGLKENWSSCVCVCVWLNLM